MPSASDSQNTPATPQVTSNAPIVVDLGKKRSKQIKQLREGRGTLIEEVLGVLEELKADGALSASAQPIIIVVREKRKTSLKWPLA